MAERRKFNWVLYTWAWPHFGRSAPGASRLTALGYIQTTTATIWPRIFFWHFLVHILLQLYLQTDPIGKMVITGTHFLSRDHRDGFKRL